MLPAPSDFVSKVIPCVPAPGVLRQLALASSGAVLLESSMKQPGYGERDILLLDPAVKIILLQEEDTLLMTSDDAPPKRLDGNPFDTIERLLAKTGRSEGAPFSPPLLAGYISYEAGRFAERMPASRPDGPALPDIHLIAPQTAVITDDTSGTTTIHSANGRLDEMEALVSAGAAEQETPQLSTRPFADVEGSLPLEPYLAAVERAVEYIRAGDIFQANLTRQLYIDGAPDAASVYRRLAQLSPAPYSAWLDLGDDKTVLSSSMELFLRVRGREIITRPIKGTIRTGATSEENKTLKDTLYRSEKDRAELTMIIDLERNDLGRVSRVGAVTVPDLYRIESFPHVHHLVSTVRGELHDGAGAGALLNATLPGGSITGAPKVRAMEIIGELEPMRRSVYTGIIGWLDAVGNAEFNIAIRTIMMDGGRAWFPAGGGIVADSVPEKEYEETLHKARGMALALGIDWPHPGETQ